MLLVGALSAIELQELIAALKLESDKKLLYDRLNNFSVVSTTSKVSIWLESNKDSHNCVDAVVGQLQELLLRARVLDRT